MHTISTHDANPNMPSRAYNNTYNKDANRCYERGLRDGYAKQSPTTLTKNSEHSPEFENSHNQQGNAIATPPERTEWCGNNTYNKQKEYWVKTSQQSQSKRCASS